MFYDRFTRFLHFLFAIGITLQMLISNVMEHPEDGHPGNVFFEVHEYLGVTVFTVLLVHWLWSFTFKGQTSLGQLFPWFSAARRAALWQDIRTYIDHVLRLTLPAADAPSPLAGAIQGLGLLVGTGLAATGTVIFIFAPVTGEFEELFHLVVEVHETLGPAMWTYLAVHIGAAILHRLAGHNIISAMFNFLKKNPAR